jgi:ribonuclease T1
VQIRFAALLRRSLLLVLAVLLVGAGLARAYSSISEVTLADLPLEARATVALIREGGPFPYRKDGVAFGNRERLLPKAPRGYYREYTVPTPGAGDRGARRIVAGGNGELYYTDDHYRSFRRILE